MPGVSSALHPTGQGAVFNNRVARYRRQYRADGISAAHSAMKGAMVMVKIILIGFGLVTATIAIHSVGIFGLMRFLLRKFTGRNGLWRPGERGMVFVVTAITLLALHFLEIILWATNFLVLHHIENITDLETAVYFSLVTFTTLGYGDITLEPGFRILAGIEAMNGVFLFGWSTALFFAVVQRVWSPQKGHPSETGKGD